jgi:hypothetical protein
VSAHRCARRDRWRDAWRRPASAAAAAATLGLAAGCVDEHNPFASNEIPAPAATKAAPLVAPNWVAEPRRFASGIQVTSFVAAPGRLLGATVGAAPAKLVAFTETGAPTPFASHFTLPESQRCALAVATTASAFSEEAVFVGAGAEVWQIADNGAAALLLCTLSALDGEILDFCFDTVGALGFDLVALTTTGALFRIDAGGRVHRIGDAGPGASGIAVAPARFTAVAGRILVAFPALSEVRALDNSGSWSLVTRWSGVSGLCAIPDEPRAFGGSGGALFLATASGDVHRFAAADLAGRGGQVILTSGHSSGSGLIVPAGSGFSVRPFSRFVGAEVELAAVHRPDVQRVTVDVWPGISPDVQSLVIGSTAMVPVVVLSAIGFDAASLEGGDLMLAGAAPVPMSRRSVGALFDVNADGALDLVLLFRAADMQLAPGACAIQLDGTAIAGDRVRGSDRVLVVSP